MTGKEMRKIRNHMRISQDTLAKRLGYTTVHIQQQERNQVISEPLANAITSLWKQRTINKGEKQ